jgi:hypothetical protein
MNARSKRVTKWALIILCVLGIGVLIAYATIRYSLNQLLKAQATRVTIAIVKSKEHVRFDQQHHMFVDDLGETREATPGTVQWRIYYEILNFDQVPEPKRTELWQSEQKRIVQFGYRFRYYYNAAKEPYDRAQVGDKLEVHYRYIGNEKEIISIQNLTHPDV